MSERMKRGLPYLQVMEMCKPKLSKMLIAHALSNIVMAICECALNLLKGVIPLTSVLPPVLNVLGNLLV
jgi:hypothetical protein